MDSSKPCQPLAWPPLLHAISLNPAAISTGHSYAAPSRSTTDESTTQSKPLITIPSHSKSGFPMDAENVLGSPAFRADRGSSPLQIATSRHPQSLRILL